MPLYLVTHLHNVILGNKVLCATAYTVSHAVCMVAITDYIIKPCNAFSWLHCVNIVSNLTDLCPYVVTLLHNVIPGNKVLAHLVDNVTLKGVARKLHEHGLESSTSTCMNANVPLVMCAIMCV